MITKLRASKISIETPKEGALTWIHITVQQVIKDDNGNVINIVPRYDYISFPLQDIGVNIYEAIEPLNGEQLNASGYGIASLIAEIVTETLVNKYNGTVTEEGDVIV